MSGFLLTYGVAIPFYGRLANRFGARRLFLIGVGVFAVGSALSAVATGLETLLAARTVQAIGGAATLSRFGALAEMIEADRAARLPGRRRFANRANVEKNGLTIDADLLAEIEAL